MITDTMTYQREKLYRLGEYLDDLTTKSTSVFCNELEQTQALTKLCKINNTIERILKDEK